MPLSEFYRMAKGKMESSQSKTTDISYVPDNELVELVWENGQVMMQGQSSRVKKAPVSSNFQFITPKFRDRDVGGATITTSKIGKFGAMESSLNVPISVPSVDMGLNQDDDDMVPWLNYPIEDPLEQDYCSNFLPEISGVTVNEPSIHSSFVLMDKRGTCNQTVRDSCNVSVHHDLTVDQGNSSKVSSSRTSYVFPWTLHQGQMVAPSRGSGVSEIIGGSTRNNPSVTCGDSVQGQSSSGGLSQMKLQKQETGLPCSSSNLLNFSHFSRPAAMVRANIQNSGALANCSTSGIDRVGSNDKRSVPNSNVPAEVKLNAPTPSCGLQKEMGFRGPSNLVPANVNSKPFVTKQLEESRSGELSDTGRREDAINNDKPPSLALGSMTAKGIPDSEKNIEPMVATSSVCSGNSAERASNDMSNNLKRKRRDTEEFDCQSEDADEESVGIKKAGSSRGTGSKRSRAAEVHNLSERRRRDRINEKMRALQELIPNCNKVDKASMLDEAIEYLKTLQLQVQIMSMGAGLCMPPMMFSAGMQHMHATHVPHYSHMGVGMGMGMGMGFGMGMVDMNGVSQGHPVIPMQGQRYPSPPIPSLSSFQGIPPGSNLQMFGHPGQGISLPGMVPMLGRPPMNPTAAGSSASRAGTHVEVANVASNLNSKDPIQNTSTQPINSADTSNSMNQASSQLQAKNEGFDRSVLAAKNDQAPDVGGSTAVLSNSSDSIPSSD